MTLKSHQAGILALKDASPTGVRADIYEYPQSHVADNDWALSSIMLAWYGEPYPLCDLLWEQAGWVKVGANATGHFSTGRHVWHMYITQPDSDGHCHPEYKADVGKATGTTTTYTALLGFDSHESEWYFDIKINGVLKWNVTPDWVPDSAQWFSEVLNYDSQFPGDVGEHQQYTNVQYQTTYSTWHDRDAWIYGDNVDIGATTGTPGAFQVWDTTCH